MSEVEKPAPGGTRQGLGLAIASVSLGAVGLVLALSTWAAWLAVRPRMLAPGDYSWITDVFVLVLGALWFAVLPMSVLGMVFGWCAGARRPGGPDLARIGMFTTLLAFAVALAGAAIFATSDFGPPTYADTPVKTGPLRP